VTDFESLYQQNRDFIYKYLMKMGRDPSLAEELTQETFFRAYINYSSLRDPNKAPVWLCQIAKHTYFAWYNAQKKTAHITPPRTPCVASDPEESFVRKEDLQRTLTCLQELDAPYREVFMLYVLGGLTLKDISNAFGKSESWARVTFYRAKQKILEKMR